MVPCGLLEEGGQEGMTMRAAWEAVWQRRRIHKRGVRVGMSWIQDQGGTRGGHTVASLISKECSIIIP